LPKLFTKFATKSITEGGTGLGIIYSQENNPKIWRKIMGYNSVTINGNGKGSTFAFSLSLNK
jgi:hypothetical protein